MARCTHRCRRSLTQGNFGASGGVRFCGCSPMSTCQLQYLVGWRHSQHSPEFDYTLSQPAQRDTLDSLMTSPVTMQSLRALRPACRNALSRRQIRSASDHAAPGKDESFGVCRFLQHPDQADPITERLLHLPRERPRPSHPLQTHGPRRECFSSTLPHPLNRIPGPVAPRSRATRRPTHTHH